MDDGVIVALAKRRDAAIRTILRTKEQEADAYLPEDVSAHLRKVVLDELNSLHTMAVELLKSYENSGIMINQLWLEKLEAKLAAIEQAVVDA